MSETTVPMLYFPLSKGEIQRIRQGGDVRKHWHLPMHEYKHAIPTLLVVVGAKKLLPKEFKEFMRRGVSVTSIALTEEALKGIEESGCTEAQYEHFKVLIGAEETFRKFGKMK